MKSIIVVKNMDEDGVDKIRRALEDTRDECQVLLHNKCVRSE